MIEDSKSNFTFLPEDIPVDLIIETRPPDVSPEVEESLEYHAARLLLLLKYSGGPKSKIDGRTKIAKLDFFLRYPTYLAKALNDQTMIDTNIKPESHMIRYKYGPWDMRYYDVFAVLVARGLISILPSKKGDVFALTERGNYAASELQAPEFEEIIERCKLVYKRFGRMSGGQIKNYIYKNFPEIVAQPLGAEI